MVYKYTFGKPVDTEAVVFAEMEEGQPSLLAKYLCWEQTAEETEGQAGLKFYCLMEKEDIVYGLGENVRGINKRGWIYESKCSDDPNHREDTRSLYGAHNFIIVSGRKKLFGLFVDHPGKVIFDIGYSKKDELVIRVPDENLNLYVLEAETPEEIVKELRRMTGRSYIPPKWAFGYGQCRWSYMTADEVREVVREHRKLGIPLDSVYLDIDYMERYKDFTVNEESFPDFKEFVEEMKKEGIHLVPIIDAGVKIEDGYDVYEEGVANHYFCKTEEGKDFVAGVWPGRVHFPDMLKEETREWFGGKYKVLLDCGIEGFWNDMNEPAIFYSEDHLNEVFEQIEDYKGKNLDINSFFAFKDLVAGISNNEADYKRFYHEYHGEKIRHDKVHNLYGFNMTRAAGEAFDKLSPDKRVLIYSRSSYIGMHRYGGIWMGDNLSWWSHILMNVRMRPS